MKLKKYVAAIALLITVCANAQTYFQQEVNYKINVKLNDSTHELSAFETLEYKNNSKDTLTFIWFHLWPNAYKDNNTALGKQLLNSGKTNFYFAKDEERGYIDSLNFTTDGTTLKIEYHPDYIDVAKIYLAKPLLPGQTVTISTPFKVKIPIGEFSRMGHIKQQYQITQWYPKPAVYDAKGWHEMPYLDQGEFYSEFGSFEVKITLPENYVVAATGDLQEQTEIDFLNEKVKQAKAYKSNGKDDEFPTSSTQYKIITYKQTKVHDFAWFADKRYLVGKSQVVLPQSKRTVNSYVYYVPDNAAYWKNAAKYIDDAIYYYSLWNGDYPYSHASAVDGALSAGGGMEYPNVTVIGAVGDTLSLEEVIVHEVGHNWFYGILGSNERDHGWMDEGINSLNDMRYTYTKYPKLGIQIGAGKLTDIALKLAGLNGKPARYLNYISYLFSAHQNADQPIETHSAKFSTLNYGAIMYGKTALVFDYLKAYLGDSAFDHCMHVYYDKWKFKHPQPEDIRKVFEDETGKNLGWFFDDLINTNKKIDYKIRLKDKNTIVVTNGGWVASPFSITTLKNEEKVQTTWFEGITSSKEFTVNTEGADRVMIDQEEKMPEGQRGNNSSSGRQFQMRFLGKVEDPKYNRLYYTPVVGWNYYDHAMIGAAFYNHTLPQKKFEYTLMPLFAIGTTSLTGEGNIAYNILPANGPFRQITLKGSVMSYHFENGAQTTDFNLRFIKLTPQLTFDLRKKNGASPFTQQVNVRYIHIYEDRLPYYNESQNETKQQQRWLMDYSYILSNKNPVNKYTLNVNLQHNQYMAKAWAEFNYAIRYADRKSATIKFRAFAGGFLYQSKNTPSIFLFRLSGRRGYEDYTYDNIFMGRNETNGVLSAQFAETDGGFKMWSLGLWSNKWMAGINLKSPLPGNFLEKLPIKIYASVGSYGRMPSDGSKGLMFEVGPYLSIVPDIFEIYFPGYSSKSIRESTSILKDYKYYERIRFTLNLSKLRVFELIKKINF